MQITRNDFESKDRKRVKVDTDKMVNILKKDKPLNVTIVEENGKSKLICLFALPHLLPEIEKFAKKILYEWDD